MYEIEQPSDLTFRISDWGRPTGRTLHVAEALRAIRPAAPRGAGRVRVPAGRRGARGAGVPAGAAGPRRRPSIGSPRGALVEVVTAIRGTLRVTGDGWSETLAPYETLVVPAAVDAYEIAGPADGIACVGSLP